MLNFLSYSTRICLIITVMLVAMVGICATSYVKISEVRTNLSQIAERDIPLTVTVTEVTIGQLEQAIAFEQSMQHRGKVSSPETACEAFVEARNRFRRYGELVEQRIHAAKQAIQGTVVAAETRRRREEYHRLYGQVERIEDLHRDYHRYAEEALRMLEHGQTAGLEDRLVTIETLQTGSDQQIESMLREIERFIEMTVNETVTQERHALAMISGLLGATFSFGAVAGLATIRTLGHDLRQRDRREQELYTRASFDTLTKLPNRQHFMNSFDQALRVAQRRHDVLAVMFIDLDGFKRINDTLGHRAGDQLLQEVADRLKRCVRDSDLVARVAGDEFTIVLNDIASRGEVARIARKIIEYLGVPIRLDGGTAEIGASIGVALYPDHGATVAELLSEADDAMYRAKHAGKNDFRFAGASDRDASDRGASDRGAGDRGAGDRDASDREASDREAQSQAPATSSSAPEAPAVKAAGTPDRPAGDAGGEDAGGEDAAAAVGDSPRLGAPLVVPPEFTPGSTAGLESP